MATATPRAKRTTTTTARGKARPTPVSLEQTGQRVAKLASKQLRDPKSTKAQKSVAASALTQATKRS